MVRRILIDAVYPEETRVVIHEDNRVQDFDYETPAKKQLKGNIYLAKVTRVEPSLQAAFVEYGGGKHGFLPFSEIHPDYYQIPISDRFQSTEEGAERQELRENDEEIANIALNIRAIVPPEFSLDDHEEEDEQEKIALESLRSEAIVVDLPLEGEEVVENQPENKELPVHAEATPLETPAEALTENGKAEEEWQAGPKEPILEEIEEPVEDIDDEEALEEPKRSLLYRQYKIQEVVKRNQVILVQVIKEERGNKGASLTSYISIAGRYCVLMPNSDRQGGVSRRISSSEDRKRLRSVIDSFNIPEGSSVIVRTAGAGRSKTDIKRDYDYLVRLWNSIREHTLSSKAPAFIHAESDLIKRVVRDMYDHSIDEVLIQGEHAYRSAKDFMKMVMPTHMGKIKHYKSKTPLFHRYQVEEQLSALYNNVVHLESGGYVVINPTEALISIDVNSGKSTSERNIEETASKTNLEAAYEIARQSRLRDLSGLIVIDFIDMMEMRNRRAVERALKEALQFDRAKVQIGRISPFGLLEMSRQRLRSSFQEANAIVCTHCNGKGVVRAPAATAMMIFRAIESEVYRGDCEAINIYAHIDTITYILNYKRKEMQTIEDRYHVRIFFFPDFQIKNDSFATEKVKQLQSTNRQEVASLAYVEEVEIPEESAKEVEEVVETSAKKRNWKKNRPMEPVLSGGEEENKNRKKRRSGGRNASRKGKNRNRGVAVADNATEPQEFAPTPLMAEEGKEQRTYKKRRSVAKTEALDEAGKPEGESLLKGLWKRIIE